jgi:hypothetical protein
MKHVMYAKKSPLMDDVYMPRRTQAILNPLPASPSSPKPADEFDEMP